MIQLEIDTEHYDLSDDLRKRINDRIGGLDEFMNTLEEGHVTVSGQPLPAPSGARASHLCTHGY